MAEVDTNTETPEVIPPSPLNERPSDGPGSGRGALRKQLETAFEDDRKTGDQEPREPKAAKPKTRRVAGGAEITPEGEETQAEPGQEGTPEQPAAPAVAPPTSFTKEAKAEWANTPPIVQQAMVKREQEMVKGVDELKRRQADLDQALQPRMDLIRRHGHTPAQAVNQLFAWFEALSANPKVAFPALADSFKFDLKQLNPQQAPQQQPQQPAEGQPEPVTPAVQQYINGLEQKLEGFARAVSQQFGAMQNNFQQQSEAKTQEILNSWSKDKPHFEEVRVAMAHMLSSGLVQPLPDGSADLDKAYDMALYALPDVRSQILTEQQQKAEAERNAKAEKEKNAQQEQANKARRASGSLSLGAPGTPAGPQGKRPTKGKSVRESLNEAIEAVRS